jgi:hypothetical protein
MSAEEIVDGAFAPVVGAIEKEYSSAKATAENGVKAAKEKAVGRLTG